MTYHRFSAFLNVLLKVLNLCGNLLRSLIYGVALIEGEYRKDSLTIDCQLGRWTGSRQYIIRSQASVIARIFHARLDQDQMTVSGGDEIRVVDINAVFLPAYDPGGRTAFGRVAP